MLLLKNVKKYPSIICLSLVLLIICVDYIIYDFKNIDHEPPVVNVISNNLTLYEYQDINYSDYIEVSDNFNNYHINVVDEETSKLPGNKVVVIEAIDDAGLKTSVSLNVNIISNEDWNNYVIENTYNYKYRNPKNDGLIEIKGYAENTIFTLAQSFIGMKGSCNEVAQAFIDQYFGLGDNIILDTYPITLEEAEPGDIIYYVNGGVGLQHYAVYLGGSSALHGNINGTTVIASVYMNKGSAPQFRRINSIQ